MRSNTKRVLEVTRAMTAQLLLVPTSAAVAERAGSAHTWSHETNSDLSGGERSALMWQWATMALTAMAILAWASTLMVTSDATEADDGEERKEDDETPERSVTPPAARIAVTTATEDAPADIPVPPPPPPPPLIPYEELTIFPEQENPDDEPSDEVGDDEDQWGQTDWSHEWHIGQWNFAHGGHPPPTPRAPAHDARRQLSFEQLEHVAQGLQCTCDPPMMCRATTDEDGNEYIGCCLAPERGCSYLIYAERLATLFRVALHDPPSDQE